MAEHAIDLGDVVEVLRGYEDNVFDAVLCDPPYGLSFMGKKWDYDVPQADLWREVLRVCKPGAPLIAFFGTRTYHRGVVQIEDAGWEIRDCLAWMYGSGFPKSLDVSKAIDAAAGAEREVLGKSARHVSGKPDQRTAGLNGSSTFKESVGMGAFVTAPATDAAKLWHGYGTALKPAFEPAVLARKPLEGTVAANVAKWGVGALAIDACRIEGTGNVKWSSPRGGIWTTDAAAKGELQEAGGRWPANVILDEEAGALLDAQTGDRPGMSGGGKHKADYAGGMFGGIDGNDKHARGDNGGASRFFYCAKANRKERDLGCEGLPLVSAAEMTDSEEGQARLDSPRTGAGRTGGARNHHPTVKPIALTTYLARLLLPPNPGAILVPFAGSGSEMLGALRAGWPCVIGIERESAYVEIARARLKAA